MRLFSVSTSGVRIVIRERDVLRSTIRLSSNTIVNRLNAPSVGLPVRCTLACPREDGCTFRGLDLSSVNALAFRGPSARAFGYLPLYVGTVGRKNLHPATMGNTGRRTMELFLRNGVGFLRVTRLIRRTTCSIGGGGSFYLRSVVRYSGLDHTTMGSCV